MINVRPHPCEVRADNDFEKLRYSFDDASEELKWGRLQFRGIAELAGLVLEQPERRAGGVGRSGSLRWQGDA